MSEILIENPYVFDRPERYHEILRQLSDRAIAVLQNKESSSDERAQLIQEIHNADQSINGQAEQVAEDLALLHQESEAKKEWSSWGFVKENANKTWEFMKSHPYLVAGTVIAGTIAVGHYTGALEKVGAMLMANEWIASQVDKIGGMFSGLGVPEVPEVLPSLPEMPAPDLPNAPLPDWNAPVSPGEFDALQKGVDLGV